MTWLNSGIRLVCCLILLAGLILANGCARSHPSATPPVTETVPVKYQSLYQKLDAKLNELDRNLSSRWNGTKNRVVFGAELLPANSHSGEKLLTEQAFQGTLLYLDRLQSLGITGVKVTISYPILDPTSSSSPTPEYLNYYKRVAQELKKRNMTMLVGAGIIIPDPAFGDVKVDYSSLTLAKFQEIQRWRVETIIREIRPDYITFANEPATMAAATGMKLSATDFVKMVQYVLAGLDRQGVLLGAGAGTWDDVNYIRSLAQETTLDYIDLHIYPVNRDFFDRALTMADIASANNKKLVIGEAWLYKVDDSEMAKTTTIAAQPEMFARDVYRFWEPLDGRFLTLLTKLAHFKKFEFISPFWSQYFFSYLGYDKVTGSPPYRELMNLVNAEAVRNILAEKYSATGLAYQRLITHGP